MHTIDADRNQRLKQANSVKQAKLKASMLKIEKEQCHFENIKVGYNQKREQREQQAALNQKLLKKLEE